MEWDEMLAASRGFTSLRAVVVGSDDVQAREAATAKWARSQNPGSVAMMSDPAPPTRGGQTVTVETSYIWFVPPSRWRYESETHGEGGRFLQIVNRPRWWIFNPVAIDPHASGEDRLAVLTAEEPPLAAMWDLSKLGQELAIQDWTEAESAHQVRVRAVTRPGLEEEYWPGAYEHDLVIDRDRGVVLEWTARDEDAFVGSLVVREIAFDEPLDDSLFEGPSEA